MAALTTFPLDAAGHWNFRRLTIMFVIALVLQMIILPCLCDIGTAKLKFAFILDVLAAVRAGIAYLRRERGTGWKAYAWLLVTSALWIEALALIVFGET